MRLLEDEIRDVRHGARTIRQQIQAVLSGLLSRHRLAQRVFCDADFKLTDAATLWLERLARDNFVNGSSFHMDPREHARREGRRELAIEIIQSLRLDSEQVRRLKRLLQERETEE